MYKLSIITVCFNSEKTIEETINSIIYQKTKDVEYIIVDGASTDKTMEIVGKYKDSIDKVISEKDNGISDAFNKGIDLAEGEIIGIINSDDMILPGAIDTLINEIKPETDIYFGQGIRYFSKDKCKRYLVDSDYQSLHTTMSFCHPATFVKKSAYDKWGDFNTNYKFVMDRELLLRMLNRGAKFQYTDSYLVVYRMGGMSDSQYMKGVLPEMLRININDGMPTWKARMLCVKDAIMFFALFIRNNIIGDSKLKSFESLLEEIKEIV